MDRRTFVASTGAALLGLSPNLRAEGQATPRHIGFLAASSRVGAEDFLGLLRPELQKLGWTDGQNIKLLEPRAVAGDFARLTSEASELVAQGPDLILVQSVPATRALMQATKSIPIVMISVGNPVDLGIVANYVRPGGNVTGSSFLANEYSGKLLQFLKEAAPRLRSVAVFYIPANEHAPQWFKKVSADAEALGMRAQRVDIVGPGDFEAAFAAIRGASTESILIPPEPLIQSNRDTIGSFAQTHRLPLVAVGASSNLPASGLIAFGPARGEFAQLSARYVDRILKGAKPGDLSIEQPSRFNLVINLKTAKALGLTIPQTLLQRADEVIQ